MRNKAFLLIWSLVLSLPTLGIELKDGGNVVVCNGTMEPLLPKAGYYSLDYFVTSGLPFGTIVPANDLEASLDRVEHQLEILGAFVESFQEFRKYYRNPKPSAPHFWMQATATARDFHNPDVVTLLPPNCSDDGNVRAFKAITRKGLGDGRILYLYSPSFLDRMEQMAPVQVSFLLVHEWLFSISDHPARNRRINRFLHSTNIESLGPVWAAEQLRGMGLQF